MLSIVSLTFSKFIKLLCKKKKKQKTKNNFFVGVSNQMLCPIFKLGFLSYYTLSFKNTSYTLVQLFVRYVLLICCSTWWLAFYFLKSVFQRAVYFLVVLKARSPRSRSKPIISCEDSSWLVGRHLSLCTHRVERAQPHLTLNICTKALFQMQSHWRLKLQHMNFKGTQTFSP